MASAARLRAVSRDPEDGSLAPSLAQGAAARGRGGGFPLRPPACSFAAKALSILGLCCLGLLAVAWRALLLLEGAEPGPRDALHFLWVSDCSEYQEWQSLVLLWTIYRWQGRGTAVTRLISGCDSAQEAARRRVHSLLFPGGGGQAAPQFFFAPAYVRHEALNDTYPPYNRPHSVRLWAETNPLDPETWVVLLDPDMLMLAPLELPVAGQAPRAPVLYGGRRPLREARALPALGQRYAYLGKRWAAAGLRLGEICEAWAEGCLRLDGAAVAEDFSVGPPWVARFRDLRRAAPLWHAYAPRVRRQYRELVAEMYAYALAFASIGVRHALFDHFVVSYPSAPKGEQAWAWVDGAHEEDDPCAAGGLPLGARRPTFLHYCEIYFAGDWYFRKRQVPSDLMLSCEAPLLAEPPRDLLRRRRAERAGDASDWARSAERQAWFLCAALPAINRALQALRGPLCPGGANVSRELRIRPPRDAFTEALQDFFRNST